MLIHCRYRSRLQCFSYFIRNKSSLGLWHEELNTDIKLSIEKYWSDEAQHKHEKPTKQTFYVLPMFPYPSGNLHMGHVRVYSISDTVARFHKLCGTNVIHPIGWDAFGLPAENAAIERNILPQEWTQSNIKSMKQQLLQMGFQFDWNREISTCDPNYYKWTQFIFLKLFEEGLAYQSKASVNWDPIDQTVLADEQVDDRGCSWRSGAKVEKKTLTQWFIKTTKFAKRLYDGLDSKSLENWNDIINLQKHWIGECNGMTVSFQISVHDKARYFDVWTSEPHKFIHGEFLTMSRQNIIAQELNEGEKVLICINPITGLEMPVYVADDVDYAEGQNVYIACPRSDENDRQLAGRLNIHVIDHTEDINIEKDNKKAVHLAQEKNVGGHFVSSKLKDWLISRQRYWGTPIPIIHCKNCGTVPVPYEDLPVTLPKTSQKGIQTLSTIDDWVNCKCPKCHSPALRETDTMDTFVDSSWYYYRFLDPHNNQIPFEKTNLNGMTPVHLYIGGKEHAVLHLYYARFMSYFLNSLGWTPTQEPFRRLLVQGMVMGKSYKLKASGKYITGDEVEQVGKQYKEKSTGEPVIVQWEKMSKSKYNGESPERLLSTLGCDTTRLLMLADVPPATSRHWSDSTLPGVLNWQRRLWLSVRDFLQYKSDTSIGNIKDDIFKNHESKIWESRNYYIATGTFHFKYTQKLSVGISRLQGLTNSLRNNIPPEVIAQSREYELALAQLIIMLAPVTPHFCCELWAGIASAPNKICEDINWSDNVLKQKWPKVDNEFPLSFQCKVDGADRCELKVKAIDLAKLDDETALQMMVNEEPVAKKLTRGIQRTKFELYPDSRAILHIFTNRKTQAKEAKVSV